MKIYDDRMYEKKDKPDLDIVLECVNCKDEISYDELLNKYGPEGLYEIANKLKQVADEDIRIAIQQCDNNID